MKLFFLKNNYPFVYTRQSKSKSGFTLIELLIVISMIAILLGIAAPRIATTMSNLNLNKDARDILSAIKTARVQATNLRQNVTFNIDNGDNTYSVVANGKTLITGQRSSHSNIKNNRLGASFLFTPKGLPRNSDSSASVSGSFQLDNGTTKKTITLYITGGTKIL
jgi:prepilin-type N-terminal cleavage/methylation domain-containing protein